MQRRVVGEVAALDARVHVSSVLDEQAAERNVATVDRPMEWCLPSFVGKLHVESLVK